MYQVVGKQRSRYQHYEHAVFGSDSGVDLEVHGEGTVHDQVEMGFAVEQSHIEVVLDEHCIELEGSQQEVQADDFMLVLTDLLLGTQYPYFPSQAHQDLPHLCLVLQDQALPITHLLDTHTLQSRKSVGLIALPIRHSRVSLFQDDQFMAQLPPLHAADFQLIILQVLPHVLRRSEHFRNQMDPHANHPLKQIAHCVLVLEMLAAHVLSAFQIGDVLKFVAEQSVRLHSRLWDAGRGGCPKDRLLAVTGVFETGNDAQTHNFI